MRKSLTKIILLAAITSLPGCAALWVADKAVDTAWFATKTTAKVGAAAAEATWDAGTAVTGAGNEEDEGEKKDASGAGNGAGED